MKKTGRLVIAHEAPQSAGVGAELASRVVADAFYELEAPMSTFFLLPAVGEEVRLLTHLVVREDAHILYAFATDNERRLFRSLIKVSGVGPKIALALLSGISVEAFALCVQNQDIAALTHVPGIGRKTAERLVMELRDKVASLSSPELEEELGAKADAAAAPTEDSMRSDALSALLNLGYQRNAAEKAVSAALSEPGDVSVESILRSSLRKLAKG